MFGKVVSYVSGSDYPRVLSMSLVLNVPEFSIYQGCEYASGFEYDRIMSIPEFWICQGYTGFRIGLNNSWIGLNMSDYVLICLNDFCFTFPHLFYSPFSTWKRRYLFERLQ